MQQAVVKLSTVHTLPGGAQVAVDVGEDVVDVSDASIEIEVDVGDAIGV